MDTLYRYTFQYIICSACLPAEDYHHSNWKSCVLGFINTAGNTLHLWASVQSSGTAAIRISARKTARWSITYFKISVAYSSLFRAIDCIEQKIVEDSYIALEKEDDEDSTQAFCEFNWPWISGTLYIIIMDSLHYICYHLYLCCMYTFFPISCILFMLNFIKHLLLEVATAKEK